MVPTQGWLLTKNIPAGQLEAYFYADCGYYETYNENAASVPIEGRRGFHWINPESGKAGPFC